MKISLKSALMACTLAFATAAGAQSYKVDNLYMFGSSRSFKDTVAYLLPVHPVGNVPVERGSGFVMYSSLYSEQIGKHLAEKYGATHQTPVIYYAKSLKKAQRLYASLRKRMNKEKGLHVEELPLAQFEFQPIPLDLIRKSLEQSNDIYNNESDKNRLNEQAGAAKEDAATPLPTELKKEKKRKK